MNDNVVSMNRSKPSEPEVPMVSVYRVAFTDGTFLEIIGDLAVGTGAYIFYQPTTNIPTTVISLDKVISVSLIDRVPEIRADA